MWRWGGEVGGGIADFPFGIGLDLTALSSLNVTFLSAGLQVTPCTCCNTLWTDVGRTVETGEERYGGGGGGGERKWYC